MSAPEAAPGGTRSRTAQSAHSIAELLGVLWERSQDATAQVTAPASLPQMRLMHVVDRQDGIKMRTVCRLLASSPPSVSRMCDRLQAIGFLERLPCPDSGREVTLRLSRAGKEHLQRIREQRETALHQAIHDMPASKRRALARGLTELAVQLAATDGRQRTEPGAHTTA
ncbi:MarR family transcriptional regulator [Streptomyces sp. NPDC006798]|uniref:MarR family winged helix-turn-helix transcriptional regulator n=1 Tax=Streptomyces sp. NPDC006798 TaxID=3155462 RepID=UPI0033F532BE